ncbi:MAG: hypothetical protein K2Z80_03170 [Xanthobacteraceae bacterium]|nr:hypothetical protein [Xanthobacteraceae bacterium]
MALLGSYVLLICHDFPEADDKDFNEWYIREHVPERVALPGINRGRRFRSIGEGPKYLAFYEATGAGAVSSAAYLKLVRNFDPRSRQFVPRFASAARTVSVIRASTGLGEGGVIALLGFDAEAKAAQSLRDDAARLTDTLARRHGIAGAHLLEADDAALAHSRQGHLRQNDLVLPWTLLVEAIDEASLMTVWNELLTPNGQNALGVSKILVRGRYRLLYGLSAPRVLKPLE